MVARRRFGGATIRDGVGRGVGAIMDYAWYWRRWIIRRVCRFNR